MAKNKKVEVNKDVNEEAPKKKSISTKEVCVLIIIVAIVAAGILAAVNFLKGNETTTETSTPEYVGKDVAESIKGMIRGADLEVKYISTDSDTILLFVNTHEYVGVKFVAAENALYTCQSTYKDKGLTDAMKIAQAESYITTGEYKLYAKNILSISAQANGKGEFDTGVVAVTLTVKNGDDINRLEFSEKIPGAEAAE